MTTMKQALEMAAMLNVEILTDDNGAYKFAPEIRPSVHETVYIHASNAAIAASKTGLEWRFSKEYKKQQYQVRESSIRLHTFPTIPALCTWLANECHEKEVREAEETTKTAAQTRADKEGVTVYAVRSGQMLFTATYEEIARNHANDSIQLLHTATPTNKPDGNEIMTQAEPGDTIVYLNLNGFEREATFKSQNAHGIVAIDPDAGWDFFVRFSQVRTLKKSGSTPDPDQPPASEQPQEIYPSENAYSSAQRREQFREALESQEIIENRLNAPATILDSDIFPPDDEEPPITSEDDPFSFTDEEIQEATLPARQKINKNQLKREACFLMAGWLQSCLEAGNTGTYQDQNGLTDEETQFLTDYIKQEIGKLDLRGTPPSERNNPPDDERDDFPLYLEYQNLY